MLTYRANPSKTKFAIYSGACRLGYIDERSRGGYIWQLSMLRPEGGIYTGAADDLDKAKQDAQDAFAIWCQSARLEPV